MASLIDLPTRRDPRGALTVIDGVLPFPVRRVYYIYDCSGQSRGGHRHVKTYQALICVRGACTVDWDNGQKTGTVVLDVPDRLLLVPPEDWHSMRDMTPNTMLLVLASEPYDPADYIIERYPDDRI